MKKYSSREQVLVEVGDIQFRFPEEDDTRWLLLMKNMSAYTIRFEEMKGAGRDLKITYARIFDLARALGYIVLDEQSVNEEFGAEGSFIFSDSVLTELSILHTRLKDPVKYSYEEIMKAFMDVVDIATRESGLFLYWEVYAEDSNVGAVHSLQKVISKPE